MSKFIEEVRQIMRTKRYSLKTEKAYMGWIKGFIRFHKYKHSKELHKGEKDVELYLSYLANTRKVSASTQNQALCSLVFLYRYVLHDELTDLKFGYSKQAKRLPNVMSAEEVCLIISNLSGVHRLVASILYEAGLRINEALSIRIKDIDFDNKTIFVFRGKGQKDRVSLLPISIIDDLHMQIQKVKKMHVRDVNEGFCSTLKDMCWQYLFPSTTQCKHPHDSYFCRHHIHKSSFRKQLRLAVKSAQISKRITAHAFRYSFATEMLKSGVFTCPHSNNFSV